VTAPAQASGSGAVAAPATGWSRADVVAIALAVAAWMGALAPWHPTRVAVVLVVVAAWRWRHPLGWLVAVALLAAHAAGEARHGLGGLPAGPVDAEVLLLEDPRPAAGGWVGDVRLGRHHVELRASGAAGGLLRERLAGERVRVTGSVTVPERDDRHGASHVAGRVAARTVEGPTGVWLPVAPINALHRHLARGTAHLSHGDRAVVAGLMVGDERFIPADVTDDLRGAGLSHLLAVSGQNVAFLLVLTAPLVSRCPGGWRTVATIGIIAAFVLLTRAEPSVLRAAVMAGISVSAAASGRPLAGRRVLALTVAALVVVDPFLVHRLGFALSVAASGGILVLAAPLASRLPGPTMVREAFAVTIAAQVGVTPLLVASDLDVPVVSLLANVPAGPLAGLVMTWGLTAGAVAGAVGGVGAEVLHLPTLAAVRGLLLIARVATASPLGSFEVWHLVVLGVGAALAWSTTAPRRRRVGGAVVVSVGLLVAAAAPPAGGPGWWAAGPGVEVWRGSEGTVLLLDGRAQDRAVLGVLRRAGVRRVDLLVVRSPSARASAAADLVGRRLDVGLLLAPVGAGIAGADGRGTTLDRPSRLAVGDLVVAVTPEGGRLVVTVHCEPADRCPGEVG